MSEEICAELERDILDYSKALRYLKGVYLESLKRDDPKPSLEQLIDTAVYLWGRIFSMEDELEKLRNVEAAPI